MIEKKGRAADDRVFMIKLLGTRDLKALSYLFEKTLSEATKKLT